MSRRLPEDTARCGYCSYIGLGSEWGEEGGDLNCPKCGFSEETPPYLDEVEREELQMEISNYANRLRKNEGFQGN